MPKISAVEPQKSSLRRSHSASKSARFNVFIDGKFAFAASAENVLRHQLKTGQNLSDQKIELITKSEEQAKLFDATLRFLSYRPRSKFEVEQYLTKKISQKDNIKYNQAKDSYLISLVVKKLTKYKYINDLEFTRWWVNSRLKSSPRGIRLIKSELIQKGIDKEIIDSVLISIQNQSSLASAALEKKLRKWHKLNATEFRKKSYTYLTSKGFEYDDIRQAVAEIQKKR